MRTAPREQHDNVFATTKFPNGKCESSPVIRTKKRHSEKSVFLFAKFPNGECESSPVIRTKKDTLKRVSFFFAYAGLEGEQTTAAGGR